MSKNKFLIDKYDNLRVDIKMYMSEISKFKISDLKPKKMTILWTLKHVSAKSKHPVFVYPNYTHPWFVMLHPYLAPDGAALLKSCLLTFECG